MGFILCIVGDWIAETWENNFWLDDNNVDLFGKETEEEKKVAEEHAAEVKGSGKKKECMLSYILFIFTLSFIALHWILLRSMSICYMVFSNRRVL